MATRPYSCAHSILCLSSMVLSATVESSTAVDSFEDFVLVGIAAGVWVKNECPDCSLYRAAVAKIPHGGFR